MRDSIICDIQQTLLGELGYVSQSDCDGPEPAGERDFFSSPKHHTSSGTHPSLLFSGYWHDFLVGKLVGWSGCELATLLCLAGG